MLRKVADDILSDDDADKVFQIIDHGDEILMSGAFQQFIHGDGDTDRGIGVLTEDIPDPQLLHVFHGVYSDGLRSGLQKMPEKVSFADSSDVFAASGDYGDGGVAIPAHFFKSLPEGIVIIQISNFVFGEKEIGDIHG